MTAELFYWWGYLHSSGTIQVKRWHGDVCDYTTDCEDNPFVVRVVPPFIAGDKKEATDYITRALAAADARKTQA